MENEIVTAVNSSVWDLECSLRNGFHEKKDLPVLERTRDVLAKRPNSKTMLKLIERRIKKLSK